jgi:hypothetical protein
MLTNLQRIFSLKFLSRCSSWRFHRIPIGKMKETIFRIETMYTVDNGGKEDRPNFMSKGKAHKKTDSFESV